MISHRVSSLGPVPMPGRWWCRPALALLLVVAAALGPPPAVAQPRVANPGGGFVDPSGPPRRPPAADIEPIWHAPSVDTLAMVRKRGVLRVGVVSVEPMVVRNRAGEFVGFSVDLARRLADDLGVAVEFVPSSWTNVIPDLLERRADLIVSGLWVTPARALVVNFTTPTVVEGIYLVADRATAQGRRTKDDYNRPEVTIAVHAGTVQETAAQRLFPRATLLRLTDEDLGAVLPARAHAALVPSLAPDVLLRGAPDRLVLALDRPVARTPAAIAVRKGDPDFLSFLNTWLSLQREEGWLDERASHWTTSTDWLR